MNTPNNEDERRIEFYNLAIQCKQFLVDHDIETVTDTTAGHMAIFIQKERDALLAASRTELLDQLLAEGPKVATPATGITGRNAKYVGSIQACNIANREWRTLITKVKEGEK